MSKIYTKTGDKGTTGLVSGKRVLKSSERIEAYGTVDELNSVIAICREQIHNFFDEESLQISNWYKSIQHDLFILGSDLATPIKDRWKNMILISHQEISQLEKMIDQCQQKLSPLKEFILPGGSIENAYTHLARATCRRAERKVVALSVNEDINPFAIQYLNRLSDLLFVFARYIIFFQKKEEIRWDKSGGVTSVKI